jgi:hypothetical protein
MARITCNYDNKEGYDETYIYEDIPHESLRERETKEMYERLVARAENRQWGEEPMRYTIEG